MIFLFARYGLSGIDRQTRKKIMIVVSGERCCSASCRTVNVLSSDGTSDLMAKKLGAVWLVRKRRGESGGVSLAEKIGSTHVLLVFFVHVVIRKRIGREKSIRKEKPSITLVFLFSNMVDIMYIDIKKRSLHHFLVQFRCGEKINVERLQMERCLVAADWIGWTDHNCFYTLGAF